MSLLVFVLLCAPATETRRVELVIDEPFADRAVAWPITTGVPFPRGALTNEQHCRLVDDTGREQPLQTRAAATWDKARTSVRWLTIDFIAHPGRTYALEFGPDVGRSDIATPLFVSNADVRVVTGPLAVQFDARGASALKSISADLNQDGKTSETETLAGGAAQGDHYYVDQLGRRFSSAGDGADRRIVVEAAGPVRACVRVDGFYTGPEGQRIASYRTRFHFFAGLPVVKMVDELKFIGSTRETQFQDIGFALDLKVAAQQRTVTVDASGEAGNQPHSVPWQSDTQSVAASQTMYRHFGNPECVASLIRTNAKDSRTLASPENMGEWMQVSDADRAVTGSLRWFWQQFPKEWEATTSSLVLHLWSPRGGALDFGAQGIEKFFGPAGAKYLRTGQEDRNRNPLERFFYYAEVEAIQRGAADGLGINKHHEIFLHFAPSAQRSQGAEFGRLAARQPLCLATGAWNCSTDVFGPLAARPNGSKYEAVVDQIFDLGQRMQDEFGDYGWWLFGAGPHYSYNWDAQMQRFYADSRRFEFHTYGKETQLWWNYVRSGERKFYDWAIPSENHWVDVAVAHVPTTIECGWRGGEPDARTLHWRPGEWSIDSQTHYVRHHDRAEAWLRGGAQFWASYHRTLETTTLAYYLTGDERFNDVVNYWRDYWGDLAGKNSRSADMRPWHREQAWYQPTGAGEPTKTWAQMIRDYAPFGSGTRHNLTLFFNLATLYEHTWDPRIGQALDEYAAAFLDPAHDIGTWRPQDDRLPANAEAPSMGHFWTPALWKYARVTQDPRMPDLLARYFAAGYAADPFRGHEHVGVYSNSYAGYAYYFTRDRRFLTLAASELEQLLPFGEPLAKPQDVNQRLYNPYAPIRSFAGIPRLLWALQEAHRNSVAIPPAPLRPQRTALAIHKQPGNQRSITLWGYEPRLLFVGPDGQTYADAVVQTERFASQVQPFDRTMPEFSVYMHHVNIPAQAQAGYYLVSPELELAVLDPTPEMAPLWNAALPIALEPGDAMTLAAVGNATALRLESAQPTGLRVLDENGATLPAKVTENTVSVDLNGSLRRATIQFQGKQGWFRIIDRSEDQCWVLPGEHPGTLPVAPNIAATRAALRPQPTTDLNAMWIAGRFGKAFQVTNQRGLQIPDHVLDAGVVKPLFDHQQGTLEFWVRKMWDERLLPVRQVNLLTNGPISAPVRPNLPLDAWAHVAVVWAPYRGDPEQTITYVYIDGRDLANYRSLNWAGYSSARPTSGTKAVAWRKQFVSQALKGVAYGIDELRVSSVARYADLTIAFGPQQTFNPVHFTPPTMPFERDAHTTLLMHFDEGLSAAVPESLNANVGN